MGAFRFRGVLAVLALGALLPLAAVGQTVTGSIAGTVVDSTGAAIPGAAVTITNEGTGAVNRTTTGSTGGYLIVSLPTGTYKVEASSEGFRTGIVTGIELSAGVRYSVPPINMEVGIKSEIVTVEAGEVGVQTTTATISGTVSKARMEALPVLNRNPVSLIALQAGVNQNGRSNTVINGMRSSSANMTMEGINIQDNFIKTSATFSPNRPLLSQVKEFTVTTSNSGAESGVGSTQINMVTPSGGSDWHGEAFWYYRTAGFQGNEWFSNRNGIAAPKLVQNQFGGNAGGPVIPNKMHVYGWYEGFELAQQSVARTTVLRSDAGFSARDGIFRYAAQCEDVDSNSNVADDCSNWPGVANGDILSIDVLAVGGVKLGLVGSVPTDPFMDSLLALVPTTINATGGDGLNTGVYSFNKDNSQTRSNMGFKTDYNINDKSTVQFTLQYNTNQNARPDIDDTYNPVGSVFNDDPATLIAGSYRFTPGANMTHEVRGGFNLTSATFDNKRDFSGESFVLDNGIHGSGGLIYNNPFNNFQDQGRDTDNYNLQYNGSYTMKDHNFSFGYQMQAIRTTPFTCFDCLPTVGFGMSSMNPGQLDGGLFGDFPGLADAGSRGRANSLLASLGGYLSTAAQEFNVTSLTSGFVPGAVNSRDYQLDNTSIYFSDSWKVMPKLNLNYGVRWEFMGQLCEEEGLHLNIQRPVGANTQEDAFAALLDPAGFMDFEGKCGSGPQFYAKDTDNFAPQVGIAYDVFGDGKTSIRAAYSIHYFNDEAVKAPINALRGSSVGLNGTITATDLTATISSPGAIPTFATPPVNVPRSYLDNIADFGFGVFPQTAYTISPEMQTPYSQEWNLTFQREIGWNTIVEVGYRGNHAVGLTRALDFNQVIIGSNGFLADFNRARANAFLCEGLGLGFDIYCGAVGSQTLTVFPNIDFGGSPTSGTVQNNIRQNLVGELVSYYQFRGRCQTGGVQCVANLNAGVADLLVNGASSKWNAAVVEVRRRFSDGLTFQANYTFSKAETDSSGQDQNNFDPHLDNARPELDWSRASFDMKHGFKANFVYELPMGEGHGFGSENNILSKIVSGWQMGSIINWQSGAPFSIFSSRGTFNRNGRSAGRNTAFSFAPENLNQLVQLTFSTAGVNIFNPNAIDGDGNSVTSLDDAFADCTAGTAFGPALLCSPEAGQIGNIPRNFFDNPSFFNWDMNIVKKTSLTEEVSLEFRAEIFNVPNHPTMLNGDETITSSSFGTITGTLSDPRVMQLGLKLSF